MPILDKTALYFDLTSTGETAHFYPGNGLPVGVYEPLLSRISSQFQLSSLALRPSWPDAPPQNKQVKWLTYAHDLIAFIEQKYDQPIIGIGHSQGANATVVAAAKRPDLFSRLILIEPVSVPPIDELKVKLVPYSAKKKIEPFKSALKKKALWPSIDAYYQEIRQNPAYKRISDDHLNIMAQNSLKKTDDGQYSVTFPIDWEVANYALPINLNKYFKKLQTPYQIIMGKPSLFIKQEVRAKWKTMLKGDVAINADYGHLIPLEAPEYCAEKILG